MLSFTKVGLPIFRKLIKALRLRPAVPSNLQREAPEGGMIIEDRLYPEGVNSQLIEIFIVDDGQYSTVHHPSS
jgi:hypothetical protein